MTQPDCLHCGGLHYGTPSGRCPYICETCHCGIRPDAAPKCTCPPKEPTPHFYEQLRNAGSERPADPAGEEKDATLKLSSGLFVQYEEYAKLEAQLLASQAECERRFSYDEIDELCCEFGQPQFVQTDDGEAWYWQFKGSDLPVADNLAELFNAARRLSPTRAQPPPPSPANSDARDALIKLLRFCDTTSDGETEYERAVLEAQKIVNAPSPAPDAVREKLREALLLLADAVFGRGDASEPDVYADYDKLSNLEVTARTALAESAGKGE